jgi:hypothetical protein
MCSSSQFQQPIKEGTIALQIVNGHDQASDNLKLVRIDRERRSRTPFLK